MRGKGVMLLPCPSTIGSTWSEDTTAGRASARWSALITQQTRTAFGTPLLQWMCAEDSPVQRRSEVIVLILPSNCNKTGLFICFISPCLDIDRHDLRCWGLWWQSKAHQHGAIRPKHWPVEHAGRHANRQRRSWSGGGQWADLLFRYENMISPPEHIIYYPTSRLRFLLFGS